ncbi:hypothetical protein ACFL02_10065, partial [Planctomycetota bacterium]
MNHSTIQFDNQDFFGKGQHTFQPMSWRRETLERSFAGLDGVVSTDLGRRERTFKQRGCLSAESVAALTRLMENISTYIDGQCYDLVDQNGTLYPYVRMDSFTLRGPISAGNQARCEYEIIYT